jgi:hypothetical protein
MWAAARDIATRPKARVRASRARYGLIEYAPNAAEGPSGSATKARESGARCRSRAEGTLRRAGPRGSKALILGVFVEKEGSQTTKWCAILRPGQNAPACWHCRPCSQSRRCCPHSPSRRRNSRSSPSRQGGRAPTGGAALTPPRRARRVQQARAKAHRSSRRGTSRIWQPNTDTKEQKLH